MAQQTRSPMEMERVDVSKLQWENLVNPVIYNGHGGKKGQGGIFLTLAFLTPQNNMFQGQFSLRENYSNQIEGQYVSHFIFFIANIKVRHSSQCF